MNKTIMAVVAVLIFIGCINWKAAYYKKQIELDRCLNMEPFVVTEVEEHKIIINDTIKVDTPVPYIIEKDIDFRKRDRLSFMQDSTSVYITVINRIDNGRLLQQVILDSMLVREKTITNTKVIRDVIEHTNYSRGITIGLLISLIVIIFAVILRFQR